MGWQIRGAVHFCGFLFLGGFLRSCVGSISKCKLQVYAAFDRLGWKGASLDSIVVVGLRRCVRELWGNALRQGWRGAGRRWDAIYFEWAPYISAGNQLLWGFGRFQ